MKRYNCYEGQGYVPQFDDDSCNRYPSYPDRSCCCNNSTGPQGPQGPQVPQVPEVPRAYPVFGVPQVRRVLRAFRVP